MGIHVKVSQTCLRKNNDLFLFALPFQSVYSERSAYVTQIFLFDKRLFSITNKMSTTNINRIIISLSLDNLH